MPYGNSSVEFFAIHSRREIILRAGQKFPKTAKFLFNTSYVDEITRRGEMLKEIIYLRINLFIFYRYDVLS